MDNTSVPRLSQDIFDILYRSDVGIAICDGDGRFVWGNPQYQRITKFEVHKIAGQHILNLQKKYFVTVQGVENMLSVVLDTKSSYTCMVDFNNGHDIITTATPYFNNDGSLRWIMYSLTDCDQVFQLQKQLSELIERMQVSQQQLREAMLEQGKLFGSSVVRDKKMLDIYTSALRMSQVSATVLIQGETGTGKDHLAKFMHSNSSRKDKSFVHVNCSAIPENLFEAELFGYESGAFTGASSKGKMGLIEFANSGTLYLDEVTEIPLTLQTKLLAVLQNKKITRIGGVKEIPVDIRIIAATNRDIKQMIEEKKFREDLFYRLNVLELSLPPLRSRRDDIIPLIKFFTNNFNTQYQSHKQFSKHALQLCSRYDWPGNVRELQHMVERVIIMSPEEFIGVESLPESLQRVHKKKFVYGTEKTLKKILEDVEKEVIQTTIQSSTSLKECADRLGCDLSTLVRKKQRYGIYMRGKPLPAKDAAME